MTARPQRRCWWGRCSLANSGLYTKYTALPSPSPLIFGINQQRYVAQYYRSGEPHAYQPERKEDRQQAPPQDAMPPDELPLRIYYIPEQADSCSNPPQKTNLGQHRPAQMRSHRPLELHGIAGGVLCQLILLRLGASFGLSEEWRYPRFRLRNPTLVGNIKTLHSIKTRPESL